MDGIGNTGDMEIIVEKKLPMASPLSQQSQRYMVVAQAIEYIRTNARRQPSLGEIAAAVNLSEYHLQRIFTEWAGLSPKRFLQFLSKEYARHALRMSADVLSATLSAGLSSPGRLHDLMIACEAMTPGEIKLQGEGVTVKYGITDTPFGKALIGWTERGLCKLAFCDKDCHARQQELVLEWPAAVLEQDNKEACRLSAVIFSCHPKAGKLHLLLRGTNFQIKVWEALLNIGSSRLISYSMLADMIGSPKAHRSVGSAMAENKLGFLIPCHRVIRGNGDVGIYHWGADRKAAMQAWEAAKDEQL